MLYLGEEGYGVWMLPAGPGRPAELPSFATIVDGGLTADVEGLALYLTPGTDGSSVRRYLVVSSQGDDSFAIYDTDTGIHMGSFRVGGHPDIDDVSDTDGVAATSMPLPGFPEGLLVVQDGSNRAEIRTSSSCLGRRWFERSGCSVASGGLSCREHQAFA